MNSGVPSVDQVAMVPLFVAGLAAAGGVMLWTLGVLFDVLTDRSELITDQVPTRFEGRRPDALLVASRNSGVAQGLGTAIFVGPIVVAASALGGATAVAVAVAMLATVLLIGLISGLDAWLYHYWLRRQLGRRDVLPRRIPEFLAWCAEPERDWIRITDAYQFRHRELLDYLTRAG